MSNIQTLAANMRAAFIDRKGATIGGGKFTPEELRDGAVALKAYPDLIATIRVLGFHVMHYASMPHAHSDAHKDLANALAVLKQATGEPQ